VWCDDGMKILQLSYWHLKTDLSRQQCKRAVLAQEKNFTICQALPPSKFGKQELILDLKNMSCINCGFCPSVS